MSDKELNKFSWYPGHIAKAERELKEKIKAIDIIIELRDARIPLASEHRELKDWAQNKPIIVVLTKADLADIAVVKNFCKEHNAINIDAKNPKTLKSLTQRIEKLAEPIITKSQSKGIVGRPVRIVVLGYPNVGKSTLINALSRSKKAKVENRPGVTKQQQWIDVQAKFPIKLLDTPGIIPPKFYTEDQALKLALCNCVSDNAYDSVLYAQAAIVLIDSVSPGTINQHYGIDELSVEAIAQAKKLFVNKELNIEKAAHLVFKDFREQKFGKISLDN